MLKIIMIIEYCTWSVTKLTNKYISLRDKRKVKEDVDKVDANSKQMQLEQCL